jgi:hypothetical protein
MYEGRRKKEEGRRKRFIYVDSDPPQNGKFHRSSGY